MACGIGSHRNPPPPCCVPPHLKPPLAPALHLGPPLPAGLPALQVPPAAQAERLNAAGSADCDDGPPPPQGRGQQRQALGQWPRQPRLTNVYEWPPGTVHITQAPAEQYCRVSQFYSTARAATPSWPHSSGPTCAC